MYCLRIIGSPKSVRYTEQQGVRYSGVSNVLKSMAKRSGHSEMSVISWVSAVEGCPLSGVPLYTQKVTPLMISVVKGLMVTFDQKKSQCQ